MARQNTKATPEAETPKKRRGAPAGNQFAKGNPGGGRPSKYQKSMCVVAKAMAKLGAIEIEIAEEIGIGLTTLRSYARKHKEFSESLKIPAAVANARVKGSLFAKATGYSYEEERIVVVKGVVKRIKVMVHVPPSDRAIDLWARSKMRSEFGAVQQVELTGKDGGPVQTDATINGTTVTATFALPTDPIAAAAAYRQLMEGDD